MFTPGFSLHPEAKRSLTAINAGGQSDISEAYSISHLASLLPVKKVVLEMEVSYFTRYKMVDYILCLDGKEATSTGLSGSQESTVRVGVSVTRAQTSPYKEFTAEDAVTLLNKKLTGLVIARNTVDDDHAFFQSILHVWVPTAEVAAMFQRAITNKLVDLDVLEVIGTLDIWVTVCPADEIYTNRWSSWYQAYRMLT